jgi:hypothetical protein
VAGWIVAALVTAGLAGCGNSPETLPGNPPVYRRIEALTDCAALRRELAEAQAAHPRARPGPEGDADRLIARSYINTAEKRMNQLACK